MPSRWGYTLPWAQIHGSSISVLLLSVRYFKITIPLNARFHSPTAQLANMRPSPKGLGNQQQPVGRNNQQPMNRPQGSIHHSSFVIQHWQCNSTANPLTANSQQLTIHMRPRRSHWEYTDCAPTMLGGAAPNPATYYPHTSPPPRAATSSPHVVRGKNRKVSR